MKTAQQILEAHFGSDYYKLAELGFTEYIVRAMTEYRMELDGQVRMYQELWEKESKSADSRFEELTELRIEFNEISKELEMLKKSYL